MREPRFKFEGSGVIADSKLKLRGWLNLKKNTAGMRTSNARSSQLDLWEHRSILKRGPLPGKFECGQEEFIAREFGVAGREDGSFPPQ